MKQYKAEVEKQENERQELANAERLFDLPITMYPELLEVQKDMKGMDQIYNLYEEQKVNILPEIHFKLIVWTPEDSWGDHLHSLRSIIFPANRKQENNGQKLYGRI